jgi:hypothetical protein
MPYWYEAWFWSVPLILATINVLGTITLFDGSTITEIDVLPTFASRDL